MCLLVSLSLSSCFFQFVFVIFVNLFCIQQLVVLIHNVVFYFSIDDLVSNSWYQSQRFDSTDGHHLFPSPTFLFRLLAYWISWIWSTRFLSNWDLLLSICKSNLAKGRSTRQGLCSIRLGHTSGKQSTILFFRTPSKPLNQSTQFMFYSARSYFE